MRLATVRMDNQMFWGALDGDSIRLAPAGGILPATLLEFIESGSRLPDTRDWTAVATSQVRFESPIALPRRNIMCLGLNYADHAAESSGKPPDQVTLPTYPIIFTKATTTVNGPHADVPLDPRVTDSLDWEVELAVVIGREGRFIAAEDAMHHVFGYMVVNDLSARDLQKRHKQFFLGKSVDGSCPMGPWLTTADEIPDPHTLDIRSCVNGVEKQHSNTRQLIFRIPQIIEQLSTVMTLRPGDIIATGTPGGVGFARTPPEYLQPGDRVECHIEGLGYLHNRIVSAADAPATN